MDASDRDELRRTQQYLAEVIDECVFVEKQRDLMERRLSAQISSQKEILDNVLAALQMLCRYTTLIEHAALPGILASMPASSTQRQTLLHARAAVDARLAEVEKQSASGAAHDFLLSPPRDVAELRSSSVLTTTAPLPTVAAAGEVVGSILRRKAELLDAISAAASAVESIRLTASSDNAEVAALRTRMDELTRLVEANAATTAIQAAPSTATASPPEQQQQQQQLQTWSLAAVESARPPVSAPSPSAVRFAQARALAYEKTVQALNNELALLHENYAALSRASAREIDAVKKRSTEAQRKHEDQMSECDAILGRLSLELEQLIQENAQLKQKIRASAVDAVEVQGVRGE